MHACMVSSIVESFINIIDVVYFNNNNTKKDRYVLCNNIVHGVEEIVAVRTFRSR